MDELFCEVVKSAVRYYQRWISRFMPPRCRFYPTCSDYALSCFSDYPASTAARRVAWRLVRCQPWHPGGIDLP